MALEGLEKMGNSWSGGLMKNQERQARWLRARCRRPHVIAYVPYVGHLQADVEAETSCGFVDGHINGFPTCTMNIVRPEHKD